MVGSQIGWSKNYMLIHSLTIAAMAAPVVMILTITLIYLYPEIELCRSLCEAYPAGCKYNSLLSCEFELRKQTSYVHITADYTFLIIIIGAAVTLIIVYLWISTLYVRVDEGGILIIKNLLLRKKTYIPRNEILHIYVQTPNPMGMWLRHGRSKAIIVHERGQAAFALYSGDLIEFPKAVMKYLNITPSTIESTL